MEQWTQIRRRVLVEGVSRRQIQRETGMHWKTLRKILQHSQPPGYRQRKERAQPKIGPYLDQIEQILQEDQALPKKQRQTAKRIFQRLQEQGYEGGYTAVKEAVRSRRQIRQEVFVPLEHRPGHVIALGPEHVEGLVKEFNYEYYHKNRPHQGLSKQTPIAREPSKSISGKSKLISIPILNGLHHRYERVAA